MRCKQELEESCFFCDCAIIELREKYWPIHDIFSGATLAKGEREFSFYIQFARFASAISAGFSCMRAKILVKRREYFSHSRLSSRGKGVFLYFSRFNVKNLKYFALYFRFDFWARDENISNLRVIEWRTFEKIGINGERNTQGDKTKCCVSAVHRLSYTHIR